MSKLRLLIDQDEVCAHWVQTVLDACNKEQGTNFTREHITNYFAMETLDPRLLKYTLAHLDKQGLYDTLEPFEGAIDSLRELHNRGHEILIISSIPSGVSFDGKKVWLKKHLPFIPKENFGAWARKDVVMGDILLDDAPHHLEAFAKTNRIAAIFDSPWNASLKAPTVEDFDVGRICRTVGLQPMDYMVRVKGWKEMLQLASKVSECFNE